MNRQPHRGEDKGKHTENKEAAKRTKNNLLRLLPYLLDNDQIDGPIEDTYISKQRPTIDKEKADGRRMK